MGKTKKTIKLAKAKSKKPKATSEAVDAFMQLVRGFSYQQPSRTQLRKLTNFTFWAGAGFSKSWDPKAPIGSELFSLDSKVIERVADTAVLYRMFGLDAFEGITPDQLRQIVYQIDMFERYPDVRSRYVDAQNLRMFRAALRAAVVARYEKITDLNYFHKSALKFPLSNPTPSQRDIVAFFRHLLEQADGSQESVQGIRTHFVTTNYDYVIETILDNILGTDDSLFLYTYRGFTPAEVVQQTNTTPVHQHWLTWHLLKINGGFEILRRSDGYVLDYSRRSSDVIMRDPPVLMLASREQDYSDPYFKAIFPKAVRLMRETQVLVLVGYSLPQDDALIRIILRQFAEEPEDGLGKAIFYIGPSPDHEKLAAIREVFPAAVFDQVLHVFTYQGGFDAFAAECLRSLSNAV
jgi:SIR2-like domain